MKKRMTDVNSRQLHIKLYSTAAQRKVKSFQQRVVYPFVVADIMSNQTTLSFIVSYLQNNRSYLIIENGFVWIP